MEAPGSGEDLLRRRVADPAAFLASRGEPSPVRVAHVLPGTEHPRAASWRRAATSGLLAAADVITVVVVVLTASTLSGLPAGEVLVAGLVALAGWAVLGLHRTRFRLSVVEELPRLAAGAAAGAAASATAFRLGALDAALLGGGLLLTSVVGRVVVHDQVRRIRGRGRWLATPAILFGAGAMRDDFRRRVEGQPRTGLRLVGSIDAQDDHTGPAEPDYLVVRDQLERPRGYLGDMRGGALVVVDPGGRAGGELKALLRSCHVRGVETWVASPLDEMAPMGLAYDHVAGMSIQRVRPGYQRRVGLAVKRVFDVVASATAIVLLSPVLVGVALAVRLELGKGVLFRQERVGLHGELFTVVKFRSMPHADAPRSWGSADGDRSIGPVGRFIRRFSLDELPQLFNILRGDMSVVGPRPEQPRFVEEFSQRFPGYSLRHRVPVGLTGLSAVEGLRGNTSLRDRVHYDNVYIENWSIWLDVKILMRTVVAVLTGSGD